MSLLLRVAYDGTDFHGYAAQRPHPSATAAAPRTVQAELERALASLYKQPIATRAASRTDAGVHAHGQLVAFDPDPAAPRIPEAGLVRGLNATLPADVSVVAAWREDPPHPVDVRRGNDGKRYRYRIRCTSIADPLTRRYEWHVGRSLDLEAMHSTASRMIGTHDYASFRAAACQAASTIRTVRSITLTPRSCVVGPEHDRGRLDPPALGGLDIEVEGEAFLMNMVRIMAGTLVEVGLGRRDPNCVDLLFQRPDRSKAGITAPARGLTLVEVLWPRTAESTERPQ